MARAWKVPTQLKPAHIRDSLREAIVYNFWNAKHIELLWVGLVYQGQRTGQRDWIAPVYPDYRHPCPTLRYLLSISWCLWLPASRPSLKLLLGEGWGECLMRVVSRWAAAVAAASMANCLMARSSKYFCSHLVMSASRASICSSFSRSCSDSRRALSSVDPVWLPPPPVRVPVCLCRARNSMVKGQGSRLACGELRSSDLHEDSHTCILLFGHAQHTQPFLLPPRDTGNNKHPHIPSLILVVRSTGAGMTEKSNSLMGVGM